MARTYIPPEYNEAVMCPNCGEDSDILVDMWGIIGGGNGRYTCCATCGLVVTKTFSDEAEPDIIEGEFTDGQRGEIEKDKDEPTV